MNNKSQKYTPTRSAIWNRLKHFISHLKVEYSAAGNNFSIYYITSTGRAFSFTTGTIYETMKLTYDDIN